MEDGELDSTRYGSTMSMSSGTRMVTGDQPARQRVHGKGGGRGSRDNEGYGVHESGPRPGAGSVVRGRMSESTCEMVSGTTHYERKVNKRRRQHRL